MPRARSSRIDADTQAVWLAEHFDCEYGTEMEEA
jgi:hypothetical protein